LSLKSLIKDAVQFGGIHLVANKQVGKTNAKMCLTSEAMTIPNLKTIIIDTVGIWRNRFSQIRFYTIPQNSLTITEQPIGYRLNGSPFYRKTYKIRQPYHCEALKLINDPKPILFDIELKDTEAIGYFASWIIETLYDKQRIRAKYWKGNLQHTYLITLEEAENIFDSSFDKKLFNRMRKIYNECANMKIAIISSSQAIQEVNVKFRRKMHAYLIGRISLDDYELKIRNILRHSQHRKDVTTLKRGSFIYTANDTIIKFPKFKQKGIPIEIKPFSLCPEPKPKHSHLWQTLQPKKRLTTWQKLKRFFRLLTFSPPTHFDFPKKAKAYARNFVDEEEDIGEEHAGFLADNEEEEEEALYW